VGERPPTVDASIGGLQNSRCDTPQLAHLSQKHSQVFLNRAGGAVILAISEPYRKLGRWR